jgi:histone acetyltransferase (RNA polymerase elongator complex component)
VIVPFFIPHAGCPHQCVFCDQQTIAGRTGQLPEPSGILATIEAYRATGPGGGVEVAFFGGTFTALPSEVQEQLFAPLGPLREAGVVRSVRVSTRPDALDNDRAGYLRTHGVEIVELGIQSMNDEVLRRSGRGHDASHVARAVAVLRESGLGFVAQLMPGLPGDTPARSLATLEAVLSLRPDALRIYPALVLAGTQLASLHEAGLYRPLSLAQGIRVCKLLLHRALRAGVPVLRIGLQPTDGLREAGAVVAGPFHPAFRQLVEAELCYDLLARLAPPFAVEPAVTLCCAPARVSDVVGQRRANLERLRQEHGLRVAAVAPDPALSREELELRTPHFSQRGNIVHDLTYGAEDFHD